MKNLLRNTQPHKAFESTELTDAFARWLATLLEHPIVKHAIREAAGARIPNERVTLADHAELGFVSKRAMRETLDRSKVPFEKAGQRTVWHRADVLAALEGTRRAPKPREVAADPYDAVVVNFRAAKRGAK